MALWPYALATTAQAKAKLKIGDGQDPVLEECIGEASQMVESAWGRHILTRGSLTEEHPRVPRIFGGDFGEELYTNEWPIGAVTSVHEDSARAFGASTLLVANTDYIVSAPAGKLIRTSSSMPSAWAYSWRAVKVVYTGGYRQPGQTTAGFEDVPPGIMAVFYELLHWMYRARDRREVGLTQATDGMGTRTFAGPPMITRGMLATLDAAGRVPASLRGLTGERDS